MQKKIRTFCAAVSAVAALGAVHGVQAEEAQLDPIVVDGSRLGQTTTEIGSSVTVITAEDIEELGVDFAVDVLAGVPGVTVNANGPFGGVASVRIRGATNFHTLVLVDQVPVNDPAAPGGGYDFARLDVEHIERIEILKGPQSVFWGSDAIGGVVAITTKRGAEPLGGSVFGEYGAFETIRGGVSISHAADSGDFRLGITRVQSDGISKADSDNGNVEDDPYESLVIAGRGGWNLPRGARLSSAIAWTTAHVDFDSFAANAEGNIADGDETSDTTEVSGNLALHVPWPPSRVDHALLIGYADIERESFASGAPSFSADGGRTVYRYQGTAALGVRNTLAFGAEREVSRADGRDASIDSLYALHETKVLDAVTLTGGLRWDKHERFSSETAGRLAAAWNPAGAWSVRASWSQAFKVPTLFQSTYFCCGAAGPNASLRPETSEALDVGIDWRSRDGRADLSVTYFTQDTDDQIDFSFVEGTYGNIDQVRADGVEITKGYRFNQRLAVSLDYAYIDAKQGSGGPLTRLPRHTASVTGRFKATDSLSGTVHVRHNGTERTTGGSELASWNRIDLAARYQLNNRMVLFGRIENLLDADYQHVLGFGTPGRSGSLGLRLRY